MSRLWSGGLALLLVALPIFAQDTEHEDKEAKEDKGKKKGVRFVWKKHPSLRIGNWLRTDFRVRFQFDWRGLDSPEDEEGKGLFDFRRQRIGIEGRVTKFVEYEVSREISEVDFQWKDVYANLRYFKRFQIRGGRFRVPFSMDQLTGPTNLDFVERSRISDQLAPNRDTGVMAHGTLVEGFKYQAGWFFNDGDNATLSDNSRTGERTWAGRLTGTPLRTVPVPKIFKDLTLGGAFTVGHVPDGLNSLRGRTATRETYFTRYFVNGQRRRTGAELLWTPGPFSVKGEFVDVSEERKGQSLSATDLPNLIARGWYLSGTWIVTGHRKTGGIEVERAIPFIHGSFGAIELATRYEALRFASDTHDGRPSRSTRAANVLQTSDRVWTFGVNWYASPWTKIQANFMREELEDVFRSPIPGQRILWTQVVRLQVQL